MEHDGGQVPRTRHRPVERGNPTPRVTRKATGGPIMTTVLSSPRRRHPEGLGPLAAAEGCERGAFYLLLALFTMFLEEGLGHTKSSVSRWYGNYLALAYLFAMPGGWIAGRSGQRRSW